MLTLLFSAIAIAAACSGAVIYRQSRRIHSSDAKIGSLTSERNTVRDNAARLEAELSSALKSKEETEAVLSMAESDLAALNSKHDTLKMEHVRLMEDNAASMQQLSVLTEELGIARKSLKESNLSLSSTNEQNASLQKECSMLKTAANEDRDKAAKEREAFMKELSALGQRLKESSTALEEEAAKHKLDKEKAEAKIEELNGIIGEKERELCATRSHLSDEISANNDLRESKTTLEKQLEESHSALDVEMLKHSEDRQDADIQIKNLQAQVSEKDTQIGALASELSEESRRREESEDSVRTLQVKMEEEGRRYEESVGALSGSAAILEEEIGRLKAENEGLTAKATEAGKSLSALKMQLGKKAKAVERDSDNIRALNRQVAELNIELERREKNLSEANAARKTLEEKVRRLEEEALKPKEKTDSEAELEMTISQLQKANEALAESREEVSFLKAISDKRGATIEKLQAQIAEMTEKMERMRAGTVHPESTTEDVSTVDGSSIMETQSNGDKAANEDEIKAASQVNEEKKAAAKRSATRATGDAAMADEEDVDLPPIEGIHNDVKRSILAVHDLTSSDHEALIDADAFFAQDRDIVEDITRKLAEADHLDRDMYVCACCGTRVKVSKRDYGWYESLFFSHCKKDVTCDWKKEYNLSFSDDTDDEEESMEGVVSKYMTIKDTILESLRTERSASQGISNVAEGKILHGHQDFMHWRRAGVYAMFRNRDMVFELQTKNVLLNTIISKDLFYRMNNYNVIWVFGADEGSGYEYIKKHVHQNTMYANKRNVFIMDKEAMAACRERQELVLKCNYLDPDNQWHFRKETTGSNGILVTLSDLSFDEELCKPFYFDANAAYFSEHPRIRSNFEKNILNTEAAAESLRKEYERRREELAAKRASQTKAEEHIQLTPVPGLEWRYFFTQGGKMGLMDGARYILIQPRYDEIVHWHSDKYAVRILDTWGMVTSEGKEILPARFREIGMLKGKKALVDDILESYYIDADCNRIASETTALQGGWVKYRNGSKWGIRDAKGRSIVPCNYDEIGSFRGRLVGFINGMFQKLVPQCEYRIPIKCTCVEMEDGIAIYETGGVRMHALQKKTDSIGAVRKDMYLANIIFVSKHLSVNELTEKNRYKKYSQIEKDSDFMTGKVYEGTIVKSEGKRGRYHLEFSGGKKSYITKAVLSSSEGIDASKLRNGNKLRLRKTGFDPNYDKTLWEICQ